MKRLFPTILILLCATFLTACDSSIDGVKNIDENSPADLAASQEQPNCDDYRAEALAKIDEDYNYKNSLLPNVGSTASLQKLFYSPKAKKCLYTLSFTSTIDGQTCKRFVLTNLLRDTELLMEFSCIKAGLVSSNNNKTLEQAYEDFSTQILEFDPGYDGIVDWELQI